MKILDLKEPTIIPESFEDLWLLEKILEKGDIIEARTYRTVKIGDKEEKKPVYLSLSIEKIDFSKYKKSLRVTGKIIEGKPEDFIQKGKYHTIDIKKNLKLKIKKQLNDYEISLLKEAEEKSKKPLINVILIDDERYLIAKILPYGIEKVYEKSIKISKMDEHREEKRKKIYSEIIKQISEMEGKIIIAGPGFEKENIYSFLPKDIKKNIILENVSYVTISGVKELINKGTVSKLYEDERNTKYQKILNDFLYHLSKGDGFVAYGFEEVKRAIEYNAVKELLVCDKFLKENKELKEVLKNFKKINIVSYDEEIGEQVYGFGGIIALLRFPIE